MKTKLLLTAVSAFFILHSAFGQGALTPPGAPAPTMKTLAQIEPRTPISSALFTITNPGSYYLTTNLTVSSGTAITIATNGVTLDLNGFIIASSAASATGNGILLNDGLRDISLANGHILGGVTNNGSGVYGGSGFAYGISHSGADPHNVLVSRVTVSGCLYYGIFLGTGDGGTGSGVVESCTVRTVGGDGIVGSTIKQSVAADCGSVAIYGDQVSDCRGEASGSGFGVYVVTANNCYGSSTGSGTGVYAVTANNCYGLSAGSGTGVSVSTANNCYGVSASGGYGIFATTAQNCYGFSSSGDGVHGDTLLNCRGTSTSGAGVRSSGTAIGCYGLSTSGTGLVAVIANSCVASSTSVTYKYNMP